MLDKFLPPTENLYKFLAISGVVLFLASFFPTYLYSKLEEQHIELGKNLQIMTLEGESLGQEMEQEVATINKEKLNEFRAKSLLQKKQNIEAEASLKLLELNRKNIDYIFLISIGCTIMGLSLMIVGFWNWYFKIQKPNDLILENKTKIPNSTEQSKTEEINSETSETEQE